MDTEGSVLKSHHSKLIGSITDQQLEEFARLTSDQERFSFAYKLPVVHEITVALGSAGKSGNVAFQVKEQGNKAFKNGDFLSALQFYSNSVLKTPWGKDSSRELSIALANRSAASYHLDKHQACLQDIELVLTLDYPAELRYKILDRKARCQLALKQLKDALNTFRATLTALDSAKLTSERRQKLQRDVQIMIAMFNKNSSMIKGGLMNEPLPDGTKAVLPSVTGGRNSQYHSASSKVNVKQNPDMGRFAEATSDVKVGDTLVVEKAHCSVLLEEHCKTHCYHCFKRVLAFVPCTTCCAVVFCSTKCQQEALSTYHSSECSVLPNLWSSGASITCHMALKIISQHGIKYFLDNKEKITQSKEQDIGNYEGSNYLTVYHLVRHEDKRKPADFLQRADMAIFLYRCLKSGGFFGDFASKDTDDLTQTELFIGGLLLRHLQLLQFNAHEISELQVDKGNKGETEKSIFLGGGLYPTLALFNHSCDPGITRYFSGTSVVVRAVKNIEQGEMIAENYGPIFTQSLKANRQLELKNQYWFDCTCVPCEENWPLFEDMDPTIIRFRCDSGSEQVRCNNVILVPVTTDQFMVQCKICKQHTNIMKGLKTLQDTDAMFRFATRLIESGEINNALAKFVEILGLLGETLSPPFRDFHLCQQAIRKCMLLLGNKIIKS